MNLFRICAVTLVLAFASWMSPAHAATVKPCGTDSVPSGETFGVKGEDIVLHAGPSSESKKLLNHKAMKYFSGVQYLQIDYSVTVVEECHQAGWSRVHVVKPDWLRKSHIGWVPSSALRNRKRDSSGRVVFTAADFHWTEKTTPYKNIIIEGVNRLHSKNPHCKKTIDTVTVSVDPDKGTPANPVFMVTCGSYPNAVRIHFSKSDVENGVSLKGRGPKHIELNRAINACEAYAKSKATHPSTVDFSRILHLATKEHSNGRTTVRSSFTAKNSFGLELEYNIRCLFDANGLIEAVIHEAR